MQLCIPWYANYKAAENQEKEMFLGVNENKKTYDGFDKCAILVDQVLKSLVKKDIQSVMLIPLAAQFSTTFHLVHTIKKCALMYIYR